VSRTTAASKLLAKYGPMVPLVWKTAGKPATDAAQRAFTNHAARTTALRHAETVEMGAILKVYDQGNPVWVVFSGADIVTSYPPREGKLDELVKSANLSRKMTPDQFRERQAERSARRKAANLARAGREAIRRRTSNF
jgi:hypothetical protein